MPLNKETKSKPTINIQCFVEKHLKYIIKAFNNTKFAKFRAVEKAFFMLELIKMNSVIAVHCRINFLKITKSK